MCPPHLLLPARKARRAVSHLIADLIGNLAPLAIAANARQIGELGVEFAMRAAIGDAPGTDAIDKFLHRIGRALIDEAACLTAADTDFLGSDQAAGGDRVGM